MPGDDVRGHLAACRARGDFPGAAWAVRARGRRIDGTLGERLVTGPRLPVEPGTPFDLASLTKPLGTALMALRLAAQGTLDLEAPVRERLPELGGRRVGDTSCLDLLAHRSGLPAWRPLYLSCGGLPEAVAAIGRMRLASAPGTRVIYSDLGYVLLGAVLERASGLALPRLFQREVARPLGARLLYRPPRRLARACAATELGNRHEMRMVGRRGGLHSGFRRGLIQGEVHDQNAFHLGGAAGHAGLFGEAAAVATAAGAALGAPAGYLPEALRRLLWRDLTRGTGGHRTAGFELATNPGAAAGPSLSARSIGHSGFTGTSVWIDPLREATFVLLTNRMHPSRSDADMNAVRREFHAAAVRELG